MNHRSSSAKLARRSFLGLASGAAAACASPPTAPAPPPSARGGSGKWASVREDFLLSRDRIHLGNLLIASNPRSVRDAVERHRRRLDEDPVGVLEHDFATGEHTNGALDAAAKYMGVKRDEIALTDSTTSGIALVWGGLAVERGDEIVTTTHDHFVTHESLRLLSERSGVAIKTVRLYEDGRAPNPVEIVAALERAITPSTRAIAITWVHSSTGVMLPVRRISDMVAKANASRAPAERVLVCVDGVHGFGVSSSAIPDLGCDVFIAGCHKWIFGPRGTGLAWAREDAWARIRPTACPFAWDYVMARERGDGPVPKASGPTRTPGGFRSFENRWALKEAFDYHLALGKTEVEARLHELATRCKAGLAQLRNVTLHTPMDPALSSSIVTFEVSGMTPDDAVKKLAAAKIVATTTPYRPSYVRFTPGITNTPEEIDRAIEAVKRLT